MNKDAFFIYLFVVLLIISMTLNVYFSNKLLEDYNGYEHRQKADMILSFRNMFTECIILADKEIDFETRLSLETAVRALNDEEIFAKWQVFTNAKTGPDATKSAKELLRTLIKKIPTNGNP